MVKRIFLALVLTSSYCSILAQDSESNIFNFTPSSLFQKGQYEIQNFNNIYTQTALRDRNGEKISLGQRQTFLNAAYQFTYGISKKGWINLGVEANFTRVLYDNDEGSFLNVLALGKDGTNTRSALTSVGPRVKINPIKSIPRLSLQSTFLFPTAPNLETPLFLAHDRYTWFTQLFFDKSIGDKFQLFLESSFLYRINRNSQIESNFFRTPLSAFISYFPFPDLSFFGNVQYSPRFNEVSNGFDSQFGLAQRFTQVGFGAKYQASDKLGFELSYGNFVDSRLDGAGQAFNLGIRYIHR